MESFQLTKEKSIEVISKYNEYVKNKSFNLFETIQMPETSHTKFIAALLNIKGKDKNSPQYVFMRNFLQKIQMENIDNLTDLMIQDMIVETEYKTPFGIIDIFIYSQKANFVCVIENKIYAKICNNNGPQLKRYYEYIKNTAPYKDCNKKFVFISVYLDKLNRQTKNLLKEFDYVSIEHSDTALFINDEMLSKCKDDFQRELFKQYREFWEFNYYDSIDNVYLKDACYNLIKNCSKEEIQNLPENVKKVIFKFYSSENY